MNLSATWPHSFGGEIRALIPAGLLIVTVFLPQPSFCQEKYHYNAAESRMIQRYLCNTLKEESGKLILYVLDTQPCSRFGKYWSVVHPGKNPEYDDHWRAVMRSHNNSEAAYKKFERAWQNRTASIMPKLTKACPKPPGPVDVPKGYPIRDYAVIVARYPKRSPDGSFQYEIDNRGKKRVALAEGQSYVPVKVVNGKLVIINIFQLQERPPGSGEWVYALAKDQSGECLKDNKGRCLRLWSKEYMEYKAALDNVASRRVYNRMYAGHPPEDTLFIMDDNGVLIQKPFPDGTGMLGSIREWYEECEAEGKSMENNELSVPLNNFSTVIDHKKNTAELYMYIMDEKGKVMDALPLDPGNTYPELEKAIGIIQKKDPFVPKPKPKLDFPSSAMLLVR